MIRTLILIAGLLSCAFVLAQEIYIDDNACPGEGCDYKDVWVALMPIALLQLPDMSAPAVLTVQPGESVQPLTGQVHTVPGHLEVHRPEGEFAPGDEVLVYTYLGEGEFRIRHNGVTKLSYLGFGPWGGSSGSRCTDDEECWGSLAEELQFDWWVLVETESGKQGWTRLKRGVQLDQWEVRQ